MLRDRLAHLGGLRSGIDDAHALRLGLGEREIGIAHTVEEGALLSLEAIERPARAGQPAGSDLERAIEDERAVGLEPWMGDLRQALDELGRDAVAGALIGDGGIGEAVADDPASRLQRRHDHLGYVVRARGEDEQRLDRGAERLLEHGLADALGEIGAAGLAGLYDVPSLGGDRVGDELEMRRFPGAVDAFQGDEPASLAHRLSWYLVTARLCSPMLRENWLEPSPRET